MSSFTLCQVMMQLFCSLRAAHCKTLPMMQIGLVCSSQTAVCKVAWSCFQRMLMPLSGAMLQER